MADSMIGGELGGSWQHEPTGAASLADVMADVDEQVAAGDTTRFRPLPLGFDPLDDVLNGGLRPGELMVLGGPFGVGKTILALQAARNVAAASEADAALYICYEHDACICSRGCSVGERSDARAPGPAYVAQAERDGLTRARESGADLAPAASPPYEKLLDSMPLWPPVDPGQGQWVTRRVGADPHGPSWWPPLALSAPGGSGLYAKDPRAA